MKVGKRIKEERNRKDYTLKELSKRADISISFLSDIESERSNPSLERLVDIAKALEKPTSYFLGEIEEIREEEETFRSIQEPANSILLQLVRQDGFLEVVEALEGYERWSKREKRELIAFLRAKQQYRLK